jgi:hypothetical protein
MEVNETKSKFLEGTWPIYQNQPDASIFYLSQDRIVIDKLSTLGIGLGSLKTQRKMTLDASKATCETTAAKK